MSVPDATMPKMRWFGFPDAVIRGDRELPRATVLFLLGGGIRQKEEDKLQREISTEKISKHQLILVDSTWSLPL